MIILFLEAVQTHGGARKSTVELAERLTKQNHNTHIVDFWGNCKEFIDDVQKKNLNLYILQKQDIPLIIKSSKNPFVILKNIIQFYFQKKRMQKSLQNYIIRNNIELVIVNNSKTLSLLKNSSQYKTVYFARGWFNPNSIPFLKKILFKKKADFFIGVSQSTRQAIFSGDFTKLENIYVVPNAIDLEKIDNYKQNNPVYKVDNKLKILHCGGYLLEKGQLLTIELAKRLRDQNINFEITIVGAIYDGPDSEKFYNKVKESIHREKLDEYFKLVINSKEPYKYFNETDIVIHPSYTEGLPRVIMEALAFKKPVIANAVGGVTDFILNNYTGYLSDFNNVDDYYNKIILLINDEVEFKKITENGYNLIKSNYVPTVQINQFEEVLNKILN
ncbi:lipopolysaccharide 1,2-N-acetylglucosaminetransferase [Algoriella xinjiangensis]|uniref:glycosyltransferase family 4 protein n=1 Tax=Algoriella xinjiangensis TaxID=684065 RepID=UPI000F644F0A|nr:glycosyltransferase family 4 protein [Algoriella xinjiangensis]VDH17424.1 lipopolysaccharide 1,2-N-acetylglucosaminetransferase [Algoriella xinjiangensis]